VTTEPFDLIADAYQKLHGANPHQLEALTALHVALRPESPVLDLGCGTGVPTAQFLSARGHKVTGIDNAAAMLAKAKEQVPSGHFLQLDMRSATFSKSTFAAVTAFFSLLMLSQAEIPEMFDRIQRWLIPDGFFSLGMVDFEGDSVDVDFMGINFKASGLRLEALDELAARAGLTKLTSNTVLHQPDGGEPEAQIFALYQKRVTNA
jgi:trans-aconitate methyltransferase